MLAGCGNALSQLTFGRSDWPTRSGSSASYTGPSTRLAQRGVFQADGKKS